MLISVITVSYNSKKAIIDTIESVLNQTYSKYEYLIIDGKSTDGTIDILRSYEKKFKDKKIKYNWISEPDNGIYDAMNKGIQLVTGNWINFMNAGDYFVDVDAIQKIAFNFDVKYSIIYSDVFIKQNNVINNKPQESLISKYCIIKNICHQSIFYNRKKISELIYYNLSYKIASDFDLLLRIYLGGDRKYFSKRISEALVVYEKDGISDIYSKLRLEERAEIIKKNKNRFGCFFYLFNSLNLWRLSFGIKIKK